MLGDDPTTMFMTYHYNNRGDSFAVNRGRQVQQRRLRSDRLLDAVRADGLGLAARIRISWYINGTECARFANASQIENGPMQLILHMMVDNDWQRKWNVGLTDPTLTRQLEVDYLRVYQQGGLTAARLEPAAVASCRRHRGATHHPAIMKPPAFTSVRERNAALVCEHNKLCAAKRFAEWSELFQPVCEFTAAYQLPVPATVVGRENLFGFLSGPRRFALLLAAAVGELRVTPVALFQTVDPDVVINQHRLSVELLTGRKRRRSVRDRVHQRHPDPGRPGSPRSWSTTAASNTPPSSPTSALSSARSRANPGHRRSTDPDSP